LISLLIIIYIAFIMLGLPNVLGSAWPVMHADLGVAAASAGIVSMILSGSTIFATFWCDRVVRRVGESKLVLLSILVIGMSMIGFSLSPNFIFLALWSMPLGIGSGFLDAVLNNVVALHYEAKHMSWLHAFWGVGASIGPIIMSFFLLRESAWQGGYRAIGVIQLVFVVVFFATLKLWKHIQASAADTETTDEQEPSSLSKILAIPGVKQSLILFFCYTSIEATVGLWASSYLVIIRDLAEETAALWTALYFGGITAGRFLSGFLTLKLSHKRLIGLGSGLIGLGILVLFLPVPENFLLLGLFLIGFGCAPIFPSLMHETPSNFGAGYSQAIIGIQMSFAYMGSMLMPPLFGVIAEQGSYRLFPFFIGGFLILMVIMAKWLYQKVQKQV